MHLDICSMHRLTQHRHAATLHVLASWHTTQLVREKGHTQMLGKSGKRYLKGFPDSADECESSAQHVRASLVGAGQGPLRYRTIDYNSHSRRTEHVRASLVGAGQEPLRWRNDGRMLYSRRHARVRLVCAAAEPRRCQKFDRREHNGSS
jgi:hypothetical protein